MTEEHFVKTARGLQLCYRLEGSAEGRAIVLISGLGQDLYVWPEPFVNRLTAGGAYVVRLDNRDVGRSSHVKAKPPTRLQQLRGTAPAGAYDLSDMAADVADVMDAAHLSDAHIVGMSLGGMIAQTLASTNPARVRSLTSIFSTTGNRRVGQPAWSTTLRMAGGAPATVEAHAARHLGMLAHIGSRTLPFDPEAESAWARAAWARGGGRRSRTGIPRQIGAINASGDRTAALRHVSAPTLVVHGDRDLMVHPSGGRATATAVHDARHVVLPGMSHHLAPALLERLAEMILEHTAGADARSREDAAS